jgi:pimeloyl-ACP methyl ester carboxylesterase
VQAVIGVAPIDELVGDDCVQAVKHSRVPLLLLVNEHDGLGLTPVSRAIYRSSISGDKHLVLAPGNGHADVFEYPRVWDAFAAFLRRELSGSR